MFRTTRPGAHGGGGDDSSDGAAPTAKVGLGGVEGTPRFRRPVRSHSLAGVQSDDPRRTLALDAARQPALSPTRLTRALARGASFSPDPPLSIATESLTGARRRSPGQGAFFAPGREQRLGLTAACRALSSLGAELRIRLQELSLFQAWVGVP